MGGTVYKTGIDFVVKENLSATLKRFHRELISTDKVCKGLQVTLTKMDTAALRAFTAELAALKGIGRELRVNTQTRERGVSATKKEEQAQRQLARDAARTAREQASAERRREQNALRLQRIQQQTLNIEARTARDQSRHMESTYRSLQRQAAIQRQINRGAGGGAAGRPPAMGMGAASLNLMSALGMGQFRLARGLVNLPHHESVREYNKELGGIKRIGLDKGQMSQTMGMAEDIRTSTPGLGMAGSLDVMKDMFAVMGKDYLKHDKKGDLAKEFASFLVTNKVSFGLTHEQNYSAVKVAELMAAAKKGATPEEKHQAFSKALDLEHRILGGLGGKVKPGDLLSFMKTGATVTGSLSEKGYAGMSSIVQELGGPRAGTALTSLIKGLTVTMSSQAMKTMVDLGLHKQTDFVKDHGKVIPKKGSLIDEALLYADPNEWVQKHLGRATKGMDNGQIKSTLGSLFGNRNAEAMSAILLRQGERVESEQRTIREAPGIRASAKDQQENNYGLAELRFHESLNTMRVKTSVLILPSLTAGLNKMSDAIEGLNKVVSKHPSMAKAAIGTGAVASVVAGVVIPIAAGKLFASAIGTAVANAITSGAAAGAASPALGAAGAAAGQTVGAAVGGGIIAGSLAAIAGGTAVIGGAILAWQMGKGLSGSAAWEHNFRTGGNEGAPEQHMYPSLPSNRGRPVQGPVAPRPAGPPTKGGKFGALPMNSGAQALMDRAGMAEQVAYSPANGGTAPTGGPGAAAAGGGVQIAFTGVLTADGAANKAQVIRKITDTPAHLFAPGSGPSQSLGSIVT